MPTGGMKGEINTLTSSFFPTFRAAILLSPVKRHDKPKPKDPLVHFTLTAVHNTIYRVQKFNTTRSTARIA